MSNIEHKVKLLAGMAEIFWESEYDEDSLELDYENEPSVITVYTVVSITVFMIMFVVAEGTSFFPMVSVIVGTGILLSTILFIADKYSFATGLMHIIKKLDK